ncbi:CPII coat sec24 protein [Mycena polygramma]|nr:CPII coat sec24 protein [Mycena polygramma]
MGVPLQTRPESACSRIFHVDLLTYPPDPRDLSAPSPDFPLPSGLSVLLQPSDAHSASLYQSPTLKAIPKSEPLLHDSKLPLGLIISPHRTLADGEDAVPIRCKAYIYPYVEFFDAGSRIVQQPKDRYARVELNHAVVDFAAGPEYVREAPLAPTFVFLLDVSQGAFNSGMFLMAIRTISESLDNIPNDQLRTRVAILCYDVSLYFFSMPPRSDSEFEMLVVSDLEEVYLPRCEDILVNLSETRQSLDAPLQRLPTLFANPCTSDSATGPALDSALALLVPTRGKIVLLSASVPTVRRGALDVSENARRNDTRPTIILKSQGPDSDKSASTFYHALALSCVQACVSVDMFLVGDRYRGVATLTLLQHYTSGQAFYYPAFNAVIREDAVKFAVEFGRVLTMPNMLEAEMRARCSPGIFVKSMNGNFFVQGTDRVVMPAVPMDQAYAVEFQIDETLMEPIVVFQIVLLHTTASGTSPVPHRTPPAVNVFSGDRRIRVLTLALPITSVVSEVFASADAIAITTLLAKQTVQRPSVLTLEDRRNKLFRMVAHVCAAYGAVNQIHSAELQLLLPTNLKMLPILMVGLFKKIAVHLSAEMALDVRAYTRVLLTSAPPSQLIEYIYPRLFSLHNMPAEVGFVGSEGSLVMPTPLPLTVSWWESHGLYLIDDRQNICLVVGRDAVPALINDVFGVEDYRDLQGGKIELPEVDAAISQRLRAIIGKIRERKGADDAASGNPALRSAVVQTLIHDRVDDLRLSYRQFLVKIYGQHLREFNCFSTAFLELRISRMSTISAYGNQTGPIESVESAYTRSKERIHRTIDYKNNLSVGRRGSEIG